LAATFPCAVAVADEEAIDERVVGCALPGGEGERNVVALAKVGGYIAKEEADGGVAQVTRLRQGKVVGLIGIDVGLVCVPYVAAFYLEADVVGYACAVGECR